MKSLSATFESFKFAQTAKDRAAKRKAAADKQLAADKKSKDAKSKSDEPKNADIAYNLLKFDNFKVDEYLKDSLDIPRDKMPQIPDDELDSILIHFSTKHGGIRKESIPITKLKPTQNEINSDKVKDMLKNSDGHWRNRKYLVGKEFHLADAHHSHVYGLIDDPDANVTVYRTYLPIKNMLEILRRLKFTDKKDINDKKVK